MKIIPVIDLKGGVVVHARQGQREHYQPIDTPLCRASSVYHVINAFLGIYPFGTFYIADLDAITCSGSHDSLIKEIVTHFPEIMFWVDSGYQRYSKQPDNYLPVLGSECYRDENILELGDFNNNFILSLDYSSTESLGAKRLFSNQDGLWSDNIIVMTLNRVGSDQGPDLNKLNEFLMQYPHKNFIAAGGIRNKQDLINLKAIGVEQVLVATALHFGTLGPEDIENL